MINQNTISNIQNFAEKLNEFLKENLQQNKDLPAGVVLLNNSSFKEIGITNEVQKTCFIPIHHGLFYIGIFDVIKGEYAPLSK